MSLHCAEAVETIASGLGCDEVALALVDFGGLLQDCRFVLAPLGEAENFGMSYEGLAEQVKVIGLLRQCHCLTGRLTSLLVERLDCEAAAGR